MPKLKDTILRTVFGKQKIPVCNKYLDINIFSVPGTDFYDRIPRVSIAIVDVIHLLITLKFLKYNIKK